jgi:hypothetical protein
LVTRREPASISVGFLTVLHENSAYIGGYLVTNLWGRPLEFRLSSPVQPTRVQHALYGGTLEPYICADLIGKTLVQKTSIPADLIITDRQPALDLRLSLSMPIAWLAGLEDPLADVLAAAGASVRSTPAPYGKLFCHPRFREDIPTIKTVLAGLNEDIDLAEPFARIRDAIGEARKLGVSARA